jgi:hypothetical protein
MLIDTRDRQPEPDPDAEPRRPRVDLSRLKRFAPFVQALVLLVLVDWVPPLPGYVLIVSACWLICRGLNTLFSMSGDGLSEHRQ